MAAIFLKFLYVLAQIFVIFVWFCLLAGVLRFIDDKKRQRYALSSDTKGRWKIYILSKVVKSQLNLVGTTEYLNMFKVY